MLAHAAVLGWGVQGGAPAKRVAPVAEARAVLLSAQREPPMRLAETAAEPQVIADAVKADAPKAVLAPESPPSAPSPETTAGSPEVLAALDSSQRSAARPELFNEDGYVPRPKLSVVPVAQQALILEWPVDAPPPAGHYHGVASLYIDEQGIIQHIRFDDDGLPEVLRDQVRSALATVRYSPGQVKGRIVKSRIRLELSFEADPRVVTRGSRH